MNEKILDKKSILSNKKVLIPVALIMMLSLVIAGAVYINSRNAEFQISEEALIIPISDLVYNDLMVGNTETIVIEGLVNQANNPINILVEWIEGSNINNTSYNITLPKNYTLNALSTGNITFEIQTMGDTIINSSINGSISISRTA